MKSRFLPVLALGAVAVLPSMAQTPSVGAEQLRFWARAQGYGDQPVTRFIVRYKDETATTQRAGIAATRLGKLRTVAGETLVYVRPSANLAHVLSLPKVMSETDARALARQIVSSDSNVLYAEPDERRYPQTVARAAALDAVPSTTQWNLLAPSGSQTGGMNAVGAWASTQGEGVTVAIVDTGFVDHADLSASMIGGAAASSGYDFISYDHDCTSAGTAYTGSFLSAGDGDGPDANPTDMGDYVTSAMSNAVGGLRGCSVQSSSWHGTHVGGTVAAVNNGTGTLGVAFKAKLLAARVLGRGGGWISDIADGIVWASGGTVSGVTTNANPAKVINLSLGYESTSGCSTTEQNAIDTARANGAVVVVAAGNLASSNTSIDVPASCAGTIAVVAHSYEGDLALYSKYGSGATISAPGGASDAGCRSYSGSACVSATLGDAALINSTSNSGTLDAVADSYRAEAGTSMAAAHVSGAAALLYSLMPTLTPDGVKSLLTASARGFPSGTFCATATDGRCGAGLLDAGAAVTRLQALIPTVSATSSGTAAGGRVTLNAGASTSADTSRSYTYRWEQTSGTAVSLSSSTGSSVSFTAPAEGSTVAFKVTATASDGIAASGAVSLTTTASTGGGSSSGGGGGATGLAGLVLLLLARAGLARNRLTGGRRQA
ncbi:S8 family serine peptidase [Derxia gummosa]|uniref:S8 family serine peptidase n=1 Tax=Derxia gummosa DSM 723 TaxID=1121388 RepID=A0A8B6X8M6_9BURK|nr:S8 family serine peptidase [Derxia gummosa]